MLFAAVNGEKVEAKPGTTGVCPLCDRSVFSKCGEINVWHWAHHRDQSCDNWYEPETEWHKNWKLAFGKELSEIVISKEGVRHIADIQTKENVIIELQNSTIQIDVIRRRERFYGERMLWIVNGKPFKNNFTINSRSVTQDREYYMQFGYFPDDIVDKETGGIVSNSKKQLPFSWSRPRRCWSDVQRPVFIDFGDENLFCITEGMGTNRGIGRQITKERFLEKYGGDSALLATLIDKSD